MTKITRVTFNPRVVFRVGRPGGAAPSLRGRRPARPLTQEICILMYDKSCNRFQIGANGGATAARKRQELHPSAWDGCGMTAKAEIYNLTIGLNTILVRPCAHPLRWKKFQTRVPSCTARSAILRIADLRAQRPRRWARGRTSGTFIRRVNQLCNQRPQVARAAASPSGGPQ